MESNRPIAKMGAQGVVAGNVKSHHFLLATARTLTATHRQMKLKALAQPIRRLLSRLSLPGSTAGLTVVHNAWLDFAANLNWANVDPTKYLYAGSHGISRGMEGAHSVWQSIPESLRATGPDAVAKHLVGLDWSHIVPFSAGGSNDASNGIFESAGLNRVRGARTMTPEEIRAAQQVLQGKAFSAALSATASRMFTGTGVAAACSPPWSMDSNGDRGESAAMRCFA